MHAGDCGIDAGMRKAGKAGGKAGDAGEGELEEENVFMAVLRQVHGQKARGAYDGDHDTDGAGMDTGRKEQIKRPVAYAIGFLSDSGEDDFFVLRFSGG